MSDSPPLPQKPKRRKLPDLGGGCSVLAEVRHLLPPAKLTPEEREALYQWHDDHFSDRDRIEGGSHKRAIRYD